MKLEWQEQLRSPTALREMVQEATQALVSMDAERLEELARCCTDLNRELQRSGESQRLADVESAEDWKAALDALIAAPGDIELLRLVLRETRANLAVLSRLRLAGDRAGSGYGSEEVGAVEKIARTARSLDYGNN